MVKKTPKSHASTAGATPASRDIDEIIKKLDDWRGDTFAKVRQIIKVSNPEIEEEIKWRKPTNPEGVPVWSYNGGICTGEAYKDHLKFTFFNGASLDDPDHLFTQTGTLRCAIDFYEGDEVREKAMKELIRAAIALNVARNS